MRKNITIIAILAFLKLIIQLMGNRNYGFHRDELLHLSVSEHLEWGFMEFPPFIGFIGKIAHLLFDYSLMGTRLFPTLAGVVILILCCLIAQELKGSKYAVLLAGISVLAFLPFYRNHTLFQPVAFDQLFWTLGFYFLIRFIKTEKENLLLFIGITLGLGLLNKYTMLVWAFGIFIGMVFYKKGTLFKNQWWYISGLISLLMVLPNIIWQYQNDLPLIKHLQQLHESQLSQLDPFQFGIDQLMYPLTLLISIFGVVYLYRNKEFRPIGIAALVIFFSMWILQSKSYYVFGLYPILFAAGSVKITNLLEKRSPIWHYAICGILLLSAIPFVPHMTPILYIKQYVAYADIEEVDGRVELTGDYADMFGWEEQVALVDSIFQSFSEIEKQNCVLWAENYGEAGALKILGERYELPNPISRHGSFWKWGYGSKNAEIWISIGNEAPSVEHVFEDVHLVKTVYHKYAIEEENGIPVYICKKPKIDIAQWWKNYEPYIFD